jgi:serine protease inhibitor
MKKNSVMLFLLLIAVSAVSLIVVKQSKETIGELIIEPAYREAPEDAAPYPEEQTPAADEAAATPEGIQEVVSANNKFAVDLYSELSKSEDGNIFFSPYSIFSALSMAYEGAREQTAGEMKSVFYFPGINILRANFSEIYNKINESRENYELKTGNALWAQEGYPFLGEYINVIERYYGGKAVNVDFAKKPGQAREAINSFIERQTNERIKDLGLFQSYVICSFFCCF